ncbi:Pseudouridine synthase [Trypanosoma melophagium]|uniref:Pseudouridine synthase n=1 Tax=Trypanosoma melophagium TaxID=715481 RepID=UPI00351A158C|nr:Pseudouridine synthase [Trypanosoma melophagium]
MHQVRGLVHRSSVAALRTLEKSVVFSHDVATCFVPVVLIDGEGTKRAVQLLHVTAFLQLLSDLPTSESLVRVQEAKRRLSAQQEKDKKKEKEKEEVDVHTKQHSGDSVLCVRRTTANTTAELQRRQSRLLSKIEGRLIAQDISLVEKFSHQLLTKAEKQQQQRENNGKDHIIFHADEIATYRGIVEELSSKNPPAALAMAMNVKLPPLASGASAALAKLVTLEKPAAVLAFLEGFAEKDEMTAASETCATQVAIRLRNKLWEVREGTSGNNNNNLVSTLRGSLAVACRFNVDPGIVFPTDAAAIQRWSSQFLQENMWPIERASILSDIVRRKQLLPRRVSLDCLSSWCLNDMERPWLCSALRHYKEASSSVLNSQEESLYRAALACALKDPKRYLVDSRLLHHYALLLKDGEIEPTHASFAQFIEECGECHGEDERPEELCFLLALSEKKSVLENLIALAPQCSYWRTLLTNKQDGISVTLAPHGHVCVKIKLPRVHECVRAEKCDMEITTTSSISLSSSVSLSSSSVSLPVIFEDDDIIVFNKPSHIATSRHALSCTQIGDPNITDIVSLLLTSKVYAGVLSDVFRQGQVHRLDTETSGCLVIAKSTEAAASLRHQMGTSAAYSQSSKMYIALCAVLEPDLTRVPLRAVLRDPADHKITTKYRIVRFFRQSRFALVECRIQQGKKHQIRRHLAAAGLPILQDVDHGGAGCCTPLINRVALHAAAITLVHPRTAEVITFSAPLTMDFKEAIRQLELRK